MKQTETKKLPKGKHGLASETTTIRWREDKRGLKRKNINNHEHKREKRKRASNIRSQRWLSTGSS
jgi:hypothetical protein